MNIIDTKVRVDEWFIYFLFGKFVEILVIHLITAGVVELITGIPYYGIGIADSVAYWFWFLFNGGHERACQEWIRH